MKSVRLKRKGAILKYCNLDNTIFPPWVRVKNSKIAKNLCRIDVIKQLDGRWWEPCFSLLEEEITSKKVQELK